MTPPPADSSRIDEDYQGQGLATILMAMLTEVARAHGIRCFEAEVLATNSAMLRVFRQAGLPIHERQEHELIDVAIDISGDQPA